MQESHPRDSRGTGPGQGGPSGIPQEGTQDIPSSGSPPSTKGTLAQAQAVSWWSVQTSQPSRVPLR